MFRGRAAQKWSPEQAAVSAVHIPQLAITYGGKAQGSISPNPTLNKVHQVVCKSATPQYPFSGNQSQVTFELPHNFGKLIDTLCQFDITTATSDADGANVVICPSLFFASRIEVMYDGQVLETIEAAELYNESLQWVSQEEFDHLRNAVNVAANGSFNAPLALPANGSVTNTWFLPLNSSMLGTIQPYLKGFSGTWSIRLTLQTNITVSSVKPSTSTSNSGSIENKLENIQLLCVEANQSDQGEAALAAAHQRGASYRTVLRNKFVSPTLTTLYNNAEYQQTLTAFSSDSAGINFYIRDSVESLSSVLEHYPIASIQLRDSTGSEITIALNGNYIKTFLTPRQCPTPGVIINQVNDYLFSFCSNLNEVLESAKFLGGLKLSGQERVVLRPVDALQSVVIVAVSFDYAVLKVQGGKPSLSRHA